MGATLFRNVRILDCTGAEPFDGSVLVDGNRIKAVAPAGVTLPASGATIVDGHGATLMPGLIEAHSHLTFTDVAQSVELGFIPPEEHMLKTAVNARRMLDAGFTSCFSAAAAKPRLDVALRHAIDCKGRASEIAWNKYALQGISHTTHNPQNSHSGTVS